MCLNSRPHCIGANIHKRVESEIQSTFSLKHSERELSGCPEIVAMTNVTIATTLTQESISALSIFQTNSNHSKAGTRGNSKSKSYIFSSDM